MSNSAVNNYSIMFVDFNNLFISLFFKLDYAIYVYNGLLKCSYSR